MSFLDQQTLGEQIWQRVANYYPVRLLGWTVIIMLGPAYLLKGMPDSQHVHGLPYTIFNFFVGLLWLKISCQGIINCTRDHQGRDSVELTAKLFMNRTWLELVVIFSVSAVSGWLVFTGHYG